MTLLFSVLFILFATFTSDAATYRATSSGSESANCTTATPCQSVERAVEFPTYVAGDTLELVCGETYREDSTISPNASGTSVSPITVQAVGSCFKRRNRHRGSDNASVLTDTTADFVTLGVATGQVLFNLRDGSHCHVGSFTATTITCSEPLAYGLENDWDIDDWYQITNYPRVTRSQLLTSWTNAGSNVWTSSVTAHPARHVWIDGSSTNAQHFAGSCTTGAMASASDKQFCTTSSQVIVKSTSNPSTRWTKPGVEVAIGPNQQSFWIQGTRNWWVFDGIEFEKNYGSLITTAGASNLTFNDGRIGWAQRHNCVSSCWNGNAYSWLSGQDNRGGSGIGVSGGTNITISESVIHDIDNNSLTYGGSTAMTGLVISDTHFNNNFHSTLNSGISSSSAGSRNLTITRTTFGGSCAQWHTGNTGAVHTVTLNDVIFHNGFSAGDSRIFAPAEGCGSTGVNMFVQDSGTYTYNRVISRESTNGLRASRGTHIVSQSIFADHDVLGINVNGSSTSVRVNDSIFTGNTGTGVNGAQLGCQFTSCTGASLFTSTSDNNKFDPASGSTVAYLVGVDTNVTLAEWRTRYSGDANSVSTDACFVDTANYDYNLADACDDIAAVRGPLREITFDNGTITETSLVVAWNAQSLSPITECIVPQADVEYDAVNATESSCVAGSPSSNTVTMTMAAAPTGGQSVTLTGAYGLVEDSTRIGGFLNARSRAFTAQAITNNSSGTAPTGCSVGNTRTIDAGTNRVLVVNGCWERQSPTSPPLSFSSCQYGGQALTEVESLSVTSGANPEVLASMWYLNEAGIAAATDTTLTCTTDEGADGQRPYVLSSCVLEDINQVTPVLETLTASEATASSIATSAFTTTGDPGVAVFLVCAGNNGSWTPGTGWTEQTDEGEDGDPGTRIFVGTRDTTADTPAGEATFATGQAFDNRLVGVAAAFNGGSDPTPPTEPVYTQTHVAVFAHNQPEGTVRIGPVDGVVRLAPTRKFVGRAQVEVETAASPAFVYEWWCSDNGGAYYEVEDVSTGWVSYTDSERSDQLPLTNVLDLNGDTFVACGVRIDSESPSQTSCSTTAIAQRFEYELSGVIDEAAVVGQTITCRLRQAGGVVLDTYTNDVDILVTTPGGFGP